MARRTAITAALAALTLLASAACSNGSADRSSAGANPTLATDPPHVNPTLATVPAPTTTTNPYAVPAVIDAAYVNRVLAGLDAVTGGVVRTVYDTRTITPEALERLKAVYASPEFLQLFIDGLQIDLRGGFKNYRPQIGNRSSVVTQVITARQECVFVQVHRDYSAISTDTSAVVNPQWIALRRTDPNTDVKRHNPTLWSVVYDGFNRDRAQPRNPCAL